ncbi:MAG: TatD family hydrolase [Candidatus Sericytochromatia bacterium]|nr:TatD family hydrolase [Candidatus Sericytochromatia bacterium]
MYYIDATIYASRRSPAELELMSAAGGIAVIEPMTWLGTNRQYAETYIEDFERLVGPEARRAHHFGLGYGACIGILPHEAAQTGLAQAVLNAMPRYLEQDNVVAVGEIGLGSGSAGEEEIFRRQVRLARRHELPIVIQARPSDRQELIAKTLTIAAEEGLPARYMLVNGVNEATALNVRRFGAWAGLTVDPNTHLRPEAIVSLIHREGTDGYVLNSAAGRMLGDPLAVPRTARAMAEANLPLSTIEKVTFHNPKWFYSQGHALPLGVWGDKVSALASPERLAPRAQTNGQAYPAEVARVR